MKFISSIKHKFNQWFDKKADEHDVDDAPKQAQWGKNPGELTVRATKKYHGHREKKAVRIMHNRNRRINARERNAKRKAASHFHSYAKHDQLVKRFGSRLAWALAGHINYSYTSRTGVAALPFDMALSFTPEEAAEYVRKNAVGIRKAS